ncbi:MAG: hypothetical protein ABR569_08115 [Gaiellaceae bacterium]
MLATTLGTSTFILAWAIDAAAATLIFLHADKRGDRHATAWGIGVFLFLIPVLPVYLVRHHRRKTGSRRY